MASEIEKALERLRAGASGKKLAHLEEARGYDAAVIQNVLLNDIASLLEALNENMGKLRRDFESTLPKGKLFGLNPTVGTKPLMIDILDTYGSNAVSMAIANDTIGTTVYYSINGNPIDKTLPVLGQQEDKLVFPQPTIKRVTLQSTGSSSVRLKFIL